MSLGMFQAIPLPAHQWDEACMDLMLPCFPLVGILLGVVWWSAAELLVFLGAPVMLSAALLAVLPFFLSGFLHLDGFLDASDAILSRRPLEDKLRILKDPHLGAFAAVMLAVLFLLQFAAMAAIVEAGKNFVLMLFIAVHSRCCSSIAIFRLKALPQSVYAKMLKQNTKLSHTAFTAAVALGAAVLSCLLTGVNGLVVSAAVILGFSGAMTCSYKEFKGVSGDLTGFSLVTGELCGLMALAVL